MQPMYNVLYIIKVIYNVRIKYTHERVCVCVCVAQVHIEVYRSVARQRKKDTLCWQLRKKNEANKNQPVTTVIMQTRVCYDCAQYFVNKELFFVVFFFIRKELKIHKKIVNSSHLYFILTISGKLHKVVCVFLLHYNKM